MDKRAAAHNPKLEATQSLGFVVGSCICVVLLLAFAATLLHKTNDSPLARPSGRLNPNEAPVVSLARLPGIGLSRARAIVALRDQEGPKPVFRCAEDLARVKGIGPATVEGIRPWLQFGPPAGDANEPRAK